MSGARTTDEVRVLLFVSTKKDAEVSERLLASGGLRAVACETIQQLASEIEAGAAAVLATDLMMERSCVEDLIAQLTRQEKWSDLPFVVLMRGGPGSPRAARILQRLTNVTILERPAGLRSVLSAVQAAVRGRLRQYETRSLIHSLRAAETRARELDQAKDRFIATLSHELRTPLTPVLLIAGEAATDADLPPLVRGNFEVVQKSVELEVRLIDDLLDHSRIVQGKLSLQLETVDAGRILRDAVEIVRGKAEEKSMALNTRFAATRTHVRADPVRLQQIFLNLLNNALKFTPRGGSVTVETSRPEATDTLVVRVTDTGAGLNSEELVRIFEPFYQAQDGRTGGSSTEWGGLGLGLAIAQSLAERQGGSIRAESPGAGRGATFILELPLVAVGAGDVLSVHSPSDAAQVHVGWRILLVEDHVPTRDALERMLRRRGHQVVAVGSLDEALRAGAAAGFDLVVSDVGLPDGDGSELLAQLRRAQPGLHGIALSGYGMEKDLSKSAAGGYAAHLVKPVAVAKLEAAIARVQQDVART